MYSTCGAGVVDGDAYEIDASLISSEGVNEGMVFLSLLGELLLAAEVLANADLEEN